MANIYDFSNFSKHDLANDKRIEAQTNASLDAYYKNLKEQEERKLAESNEKSMSDVRFSMSSGIARSKNRAASATEDLRYITESATIGMTEMLTAIVEEALLIDDKEYAKLNEDYKTTIHDTVKSFLENANISQDVKNPNTLTIMNYVSSVLPETKVGKYMTENAISSLVNKQKPAIVEAAIKKLSGDVKGKVAELVESDSKKAKQIDDDLGEVIKSSKKNAEAAPEDVNVDDGSGEAVGVDDQGIPVDANGQPVEDPNAVAEDPNSVAQLDVAPADSNAHQTNIHINPDSSIDIQTTAAPAVADAPVMQENILVNETPRSGLIESLAVNEAENMIKDGKSYNPDLALANAIMYTTIVEAFDITGLVPVTQNTFAHIITEAGGTPVYQPGKIFIQEACKSKTKAPVKKAQAKDITNDADAQKAFIERIRRKHSK